VDIFFFLAKKEKIYEKRAFPITSTVGLWYDEVIKKKGRMTMKKSIRAISVCIVVMLFLGGCQKKVTAETPTTYDDAKDQQLAEATTKLSYYEDLVGVLQQQMLDLKSALYASRAEYDALYSIYQAINKQTDGSSTDADTSVSIPNASDSFRYIKEGEHIVITSYYGTEKEVLVPMYIEGLPVYAIFDRAFSQNNTITSVTIPDSVTKIGWFAFSGCVALKQLSIPSSVTEISYGAFENCSAELTVISPQDSYATQYAKSYGIKTRS